MIYISGEEILWRELRKRKRRTPTECKGCAITPETAWRSKIAELIGIVCSAPRFINNQLFERLLWNSRNSEEQLWRLYRSGNWWTRKACGVDWFNGTKYSNCYRRNYIFFYNIETVSDTSKLSNEEGFKELNSIYNDEMMKKINEFCETVQTNPTMSEGLELDFELTKDQRKRVFASSSFLVSGSSNHSRVFPFFVVWHQQGWKYHALFPQEQRYFSFWDGWIPTRAFKAIGTQWVAHERYWLCDVHIEKSMLWLQFIHRSFYRKTWIQCLVWANWLQNNTESPISTLMLVLRTNVQSPIRRLLAIAFFLYMALLTLIDCRSRFITLQSCSRMSKWATLHLRKNHCELQIVVYRHDWLCYAH